jgi:hypothetical protein
MRVIAYVEGASDKLGMEALLRPLIEEKRQAGVEIQFFESPKGDRKTSVLTKVPIKAANILLNDPYAVVVALPDLYPRNKGFPHEAVNELVEGVTENFRNALRQKSVGNPAELESRFRVFCFKYDVEVLLLAAEELLGRHLGVSDIAPTWRTPVEDQDHEHPPRKIIERLFEQHGTRYVGTSDLPLILGAADYRQLAERCPQCFGPFVSFLMGLQGS